MIQIIGTKKCKETAKAVRACKERKLAYQFVDLHERELSKGEWHSVFLAYNPASLIDESSTYFKKEGYSYRSYDPQEELQEHPQLLKTPLLRCKNRVHLGYDLAIIENWGSA
ncbi:MAG: hypothetical protein EOM15_02775 [Spirochaetia bacterium]|nr:hypothetical protein [Spirochaetia bacterium]